MAKSPAKLSLPESTLKICSRKINLKLFQRHLHCLPGKCRPAVSRKNDILLFFGVINVLNVDKENMH